MKIAENSLAADSPTSSTYHVASYVLVFSFFVKFTFNITRLLCTFAYNSDFDGAERELGKGADVNGHNNYGFLPISNAASKGHSAMIGLLLEHGADVNKTEKDGVTTAIHKAATNGHAEAVRVLLNAGAKPGQPNAAGKTPMQIAIALRHHGVAKMISDPASRAQPYKETDTGQWNGGASCCVMQ